MSRLRAAFLLFALVSLIDASAASAQHEGPVLRGPVRAYAALALAPDDETEHVTRMVRVHDGYDIGEVAGRLMAHPDGERAVFFWHMVGGLLRNAQDRCQTPQGTYTDYQCPFLENGTDSLQAMAHAFFRDLHEAGGDVDVVPLDHEYDFSNWSINRSWRDAIIADPRSSRLAERLAPYRLEEIMNTGQDDYLYWNDLQWRIIAEALSEAVYEEAKRFFPDVRMSNYGHFVMDEANAVPDPQGHEQFVTSHVGTHSARPFYGRVGSRGEGPWESLLYYMNIARAIGRSSDVPFTPWISHKAFPASDWAGTPYYEEAVFHLALSGADDFYYWNDPSSGADAAQDLLVDRLMGALNEQIGAAPRQSVTLGEVPMSAPILATGMEVGADRVVWRVTAPPGATYVVAQPSGTVLPLGDEAGAWHETAPDEEVSFEVGWGRPPGAMRLEAGWNLVSAPVHPNAPGLEDFFAEVAGQVAVVKDERGRVFIPEYGINQIGAWDPGEAYKVYMRAAEAFDVSGRAVEASAPLPLEAGWNYLPYLLDHATPIADALGSIAQHIVLVKDAEGRAYLPQDGIDTIGEMEPGQGYAVYLRAPATLTYPAPQAPERAAGSYAKRN